MTDPKRWLDDAGFASSLERELLLSGKQLAPPEGAVSQGWAELAPLLGPGLGPGSGSSGGSEPSGPSGTGLDAASGSLSLGSGASSLGAGTLKAFVIGAALGAGVMGVVQVTRAPRPAPASVVLATPPAPPVVHAPPSQLSAPTGEAQEQPGQPEPPNAAPEPAKAALPAPPNARAVAGPATPVAQRAGVLAAPAAAAPVANAELPPSPSPLAEAAPAASASVTHTGDNVASPGPAPSGGPGSANWLRAEAQDMARARNLLSSGRAAEALSLLQSAADRFGGGALAQEREALIVEALFGSGRTEQARARARAFVQKYPNSPMSERMKRLERFAR